MPTRHWDMIAKETFKLPDGFDPCKDFSISGGGIIDEPESGLDDLFN